tara:strand:- start:165 stop:551 length:387 start_codon:yes stop_codon:yes gene_type:complete
MKITKEELANIIKEEVEKVLEEQPSEQQVMVAKDNERTRFAMQIDDARRKFRNAFGDLYALYSPRKGGTIDGLLKKGIIDEEFDEKYLKTMFYDVMLEHSRLIDSIFDANGKVFQALRKGQFEPHKND